MIVGRTRSERSIRFFQKAIILAFSPRLAPAPSTLLTYTLLLKRRRTALLPSVDWIFHLRESLQDGVYSVPGFLQERATHISLETVLARRFAGRRTNIYGFKPTMGVVRRVVHH